MRKRAYLYGREMIWPQVARRYMESFQRARVERRHFTPPGFVVKALDKRPAELPPLKLDHLRRMTDDTGMFQHAIFTLPKYNEGYTIDDNARALTVSTLLEELGSEEIADLMSRYFAFVWYAFNAKTGRFRNFMSYQRLGRKRFGRQSRPGLVGGGHGVGKVEHTCVANMAGWVFEKSCLPCSTPPAPGMGLRAHRHHEYLQRFAGDRTIAQAREVLAGRLVELYRHIAPTTGVGMKIHELLQCRAAPRLAHVRPNDQ
jgi:hypothetical protein